MSAGPVPRAVAERCAGLIFLCCAFLGLSVATAAGAPLYDTPVYEPSTGNYFELRRATPGYSLRGGTPAIGWSKAQALASKSVYKQARGRLAVVKSKEINDFLRRTFQPDQGAWIGLRYWCGFNKLQWVTGEFYRRTDYSNWAAVWNHAGSKGAKLGKPSCDRKGTYWPVHYWPSQDGFHWNANGQKKEMRAFFIEYPAGSR